MTVRANRNMQHSVIRNRSVVSDCILSFVYERVTLEFAYTSSNTYEKSKAFRFTLCVRCSWEADL
jgi:hypothetical protein